MGFQSWFKNTKPIMPVIVLEKESDAIPLAEALIEGGIHCLEITLRTAAGLKSIETIAKKIPEAIVGVGTVTSPEQMQQAVDSGAKFAISPGISKELCEISNQLNIPYAPGVMTPSEILLGLPFGISLFKYFPAEIAGGLKGVKAMSGPFPDIQFCPTGGISETNYKDYLALKSVVAVGGSWVCPAELIKDQNWAEITRRAKAI